VANTLATRKQSEAIRHKMQLIRNQLPEDVDSARARARQLTDWKYHMSRHPWPVLAGVACLGYWLVPASSGSKHQQSFENVDATPSARRPGAMPGISRRAKSENEPVPKRSFFGGLAAAAATMALRSAGTMATRYLTDRLTAASGLSDHPDQESRSGQAHQSPMGSVPFAKGFSAAKAGAGPTPPAATSKSTLDPNGPAWDDQLGMSPTSEARKP